MPRCETEAIILGCVDFGESDRIVSALTKDRGIIAAVAKGARNSRKRFPGTLEPFSDVTLDLFIKPGQDLYRVEAASLNSANLGIREDLEVCAHAAVLVEIIKEHLGLLDPCPVTYASLSSALGFLSPGGQWFSVWSIAMLKILSSLGYGLNLAEIERSRFAPEVQVFITKGLELEPAVLNKLGLSPRARAELQAYLFKTCQAITERPLKSLGFLGKLLDGPQNRC